MKLVPALLCASLVATAFGATAADLKRGERKFLETVAQHNMAEVQTGKLAQSKGVSAEVKNFGKQMAEDHGKNYEEVVALAKAKGVALPGEPDKGHKKDADKLSKLSGADFDKAYMKGMLKDHEKDVKEFDKMSKDAKDPDVKAFAAKTYPVLEGHLKMARDVNAAVSKAK